MVDLDQHGLVEVLNSDKQDEITAALEVYPSEVRAEVEEVSVDMWGGYPAVIERVFPHAKIVYDRFHVMQQCQSRIEPIETADSGQVQRLAASVMEESRDLNRRALISNLMRG